MNLYQHTPEYHEKARRQTEATTAVPQSVDMSRPVDAAEHAPRMTHPDKIRLRDAAYRAKRIYPGAVGQLIAREFMAHEELSAVLRGDGIITRAVDEILATPLPPT